MSGGVKAPPDKAAKQLRVHEHVAKRNANVRFTRKDREKHEDKEKRSRLTALF